MAGNTDAELTSLTRAMACRSLAGFQSATERQQQQQGSAVMGQESQLLDN
jgi:hypothetical protein